MREQTALKLLSLGGNKAIKRGTVVLADDVVIDDKLAIGISSGTAVLIYNSYVNSSKYSFLKENKELEPKQVLEVIKDVQNTFGVLVKVGKKIKWVQTKGRFG